jgi:hypothetical protein
MAEHVPSMQRNGSVEIIPHRILVESKTEKEKKQKQKTKMQEMKYVRKKKNNKRDIHQLYEQRKDKAIPKHKPTTESDGAYIYIYIYIYQQPYDHHPSHRLCD